MTTDLKGQDLAKKIEDHLPGVTEEAAGNSVVVKGESLLSVARFLKDTPELSFDYLSTLIGTDYLDYIEVVYILESLKHNHRIFLKARTYDRDKAALPSVVGVWKGADLQEREAFDLLGVTFTGHPFLKHIVLWDGFEGHPLRRDYL